MNEREQLHIEDAKMIFKHFSGLEDDFHADGIRDFVLLVDDGTADFLRNHAIAVKTVENDDGTHENRTKVHVSYKKQAPTIAVVKAHSLDYLDQSSIAALDHATIERADMTVDIVYWEMPKTHKNGFTLYLNSLYVKIEENPFAAKWAHGYANDAEPDPDDTPFA